MPGDASRHLRKGMDILGRLSEEERAQVYIEMIENPVRQKNMASVFRPMAGLEELSQSGGGSARFWNSVKKQPRVFLSHSHTDKVRARHVGRYLEGQGIKVWIDEGELRFGDSLVEKLSRAIAEVDFLVAMISPASIDSEWVKRELDVAMNQEIKQKRVKVIPIAVGSVAMPGFLEGKLYADFTNPYRQKKNLPALAASIRKHYQDLSP